jgi:hypothetical protein
VDELPTFGRLESVAVWGLEVAFKEAYNASALQIWSASIDIHLILLHVVFEDGLPIPILSNRAPCSKNLHLEIVTS